MKITFRSPSSLSSPSALGLLGLSATLVLLLSVGELAFAKDLVEAASTAQTMINRIGIAAISIGFTIGGILYAMGIAMIGRMILISGAIGAVAILAAPAIINLLARVFGASL